MPALMDASKNHLSNVPRRGPAVLFYQGVPEFSHVAKPVFDSKKYIMRSDVLYHFKDATAADVGGPPRSPLNNAAR